MMTKVLNADEVYKMLLETNIIGSNGCITFELAGVKVQIDTTDTVGITLQSWLKQWLIKNNIHFSEPFNTQEFPDFYLDNNNREFSMLEVKSFKYSASPAFDIANFESYCASLETEAYRLDADYIIFGYDMNEEGSITIERIWLKKVWEIAGTSSKYPLKTQIKKHVIYNIRPSPNFKRDREPVFKNKEEFLKAIYGTLLLYRGIEAADKWLDNTMKSYYHYTNQVLEIF